MSFANRVRAAFMTSIADLFFGACAILIVLVVIPRQPVEEKKIERFVDLQVWCERRANEWALVTQDGSRRTLPQWLEAETASALLVRVGVWVKRTDMECYRRFAEAAHRHNAALTHRGKVSGSVSPVLLADDGTRASPGGVPQ